MLIYLIQIYTILNKSRVELHGWNKMKNRSKQWIKRRRRRRRIRRRNLYKQNETSGEFCGLTNLFFHFQAHRQSHHPHPAAVRLFLDANFLMVLLKMSLTLLLPINKKIRRHTTHSHVSLPPRANISHAAGVLRFCHFLGAALRGGRS